MSKRPSSFKPAVMQNPNGDSDIYTAKRYLHLSDGPSTDLLTDASRPERTTPAVLAKLASLMLRSGKGNEVQTNPEVSYYGAWALLEAALPGYFTPFEEDEIYNFDGLPTTQNTRSLLIEALGNFDKLERRQPFVGTSVVPHNDVDFRAFLYGHRARMVTDLRPYLVHEGYPVKNLAEMKKRTTEAAKKVASNYAQSAFLISKQIDCLTQIRIKREFTEKEEELIISLTGLEPENKLLGLLWQAYALGYSPIIALPASPRIDYGFKKPANTRCDVVLVNTHTGEHAGYDVERNVVAARTEISEYEGGRIRVPKKLDDAHPRVAHLYGDRDMSMKPFGDILRRARAVERSSDSTEYGFDTNLAPRIALLASNLFFRLAEANANNSAVEQTDIKTA